jgi:hypothetical protein
MKATLLSADKEGSSEWLNKTLTPIFNKLASIKGVSKDTSVMQFSDIPSYKAFFDAAFGPEKTMPHKVKRHGPGEMEEAELLPMGIRPMDSVLMTKEDINNPNLAEALEKAMPRMPNGQLRGNIASGLKIHQLGSDTSVHPIWRKAYSHLIATGSGKTEIDVAPLRALSKVNAAYSNEVSHTAIQGPLCDLSLTYYFRLQEMSQTGRMSSGGLTTTNSLPSKLNTILMAFSGPLPVSMPTSSTLLADASAKSHPPTPLSSLVSHPLRTTQTSLWTVMAALTVVLSHSYGMELPLLKLLERTRSWRMERLAKWLLDSATLSNARQLVGLEMKPRVHDSLYILNDP